VAISPEQSLHLELRVSIEMTPLHAFGDVIPVGGDHQKAVGRQQLVPHIKQSPPLRNVDMGEEGAHPDEIVAMFEQSRIRLSRSMPTQSTELPRAPVNSVGQDIARCEASARIGSLEPPQYPPVPTGKV
jgi:hypothetical protein